ncbi:MAG: hypothetical protein H7343_15585 [Undibacterium sp.]|nr:hypothetical protein [Opitutaceae bacterium]
MITSTTSTDRALRPDTVSVAGQPPARAAAPRVDTLNTESAAALRRALAEQPEIRPEVVERARALAADPGYPSAAIIQRVSEQILGSPDLSEDQS